MKEFKEFLNAVQNNEFVKGHEILEELWKEYKKIESLKDEAYILKGLINASTALALKVKEKDDGAKRVWATFLKYSPLIDKINSKNLPFYKESKELLLKKALVYEIET